MGVCGRDDRTVRGPPAAPGVSAPLKGGAAALSPARIIGCVTSHSLSDRLPPVAARPGRRGPGRLDSE
eukprot:766519-Hanusia_phi.AAC.3